MVLFLTNPIGSAKKKTSERLVFFATPSNCIGDAIADFCF